MDKFITCDTNGISLDTLIRSLMVKHTDGTKGFRTVVINVTDCDDLSPAIDCDNQASTETEFRNTIVLDACGQPAIALFNTKNAT